MMYGDILENHDGALSMLLLCLASVVYHIKVINDIVVNEPGHALSALPILQKPDLILRLNSLVTRTPSQGMSATGVPPHVNHLRSIKDMHVDLRKTVSCFDTHTKDIVMAVRDAINDNDIRSGVVNIGTLEVSFALNLYK